MSRTFVLQTDANGLLDGHVNATRLAIDEYLWLRPDEKDDIRVCYSVQGLGLAPTPSATPTSYQIARPNNDNLHIPVGSVEFCEDCLKRWYGVERIEPINIPPELLKEEFTHRMVRYVDNAVSFNAFVEKNNQTHFIPMHPLFLKPVGRVKQGAPWVYDPNDACRKEPVFPGKYMVSEYIDDILSEWRVFVRNGKILDIRCYSGNPWSMPSEKSVQAMVDAYTDCPPAYTLDVALIWSGTQPECAILEVHNFIACGLYGFSDATNIVLMSSAAVRYEIKKGGDHV